MNDQSTVDKLKKRYLNFAKFEAKNNSPLYEAFATAVAENNRVLERLAVLPRKKQQPNLLLAAVRLKYGVPRDTDDFCNIVMRDWDEIKAIMLTRSTQTNEPARCATLLPVMAGLTQPIALLEVGAAAGLCLFPDKYAYDYGEVELSQAREIEDPPTFKCRVSGNTPVPLTLPSVSWRAGIDIHPLSVQKETDMNWLRLLVWPEQTDRLANLDRAIQVVQSDPPRIVEGDLLTNLDLLISDMPNDATPVLFHSAVLAYLTRSEREHFVSFVSSLDVTWISNEHPSVLPENLKKIRTDVPRDRFLLSVNGNPVAMTGPHGQSIDWF